MICEKALDIASETLLLVPGLRVPKDEYGGGVGSKQASHAICQLPLSMLTCSMADKRSMHRALASSTFGG